MAVLQTPDGTTLQVPDNATPDQVKAIFSAYESERTESSAQAGRDAAWEETPWPEKLAVGFAKPFVETGLGIKSLMTDLSQDNENMLEAGKGVKGVAGTTGEIAGNLATFAIPAGGAAGVGARAAAKVPGLMAKGAARLAPEAAAVAGMEALKAPTANRSRAQAAGQALVGVGAGAAVGSVLKRTLAGVAKSDAAKRLATDVDLTPGMAAQGSLVPWLEKRMAALPMVGSKVERLQNKALNQWNVQTLKSVVPHADDITTAGKQGFQQASRSFRKAYAGIWDRKIPVTGLRSVSNVVDGFQKRLSSKEFHKAVRDLGQVEEMLEVSFNMLKQGQNNGNVLSQVDDVLRNYISLAKRKGKPQLTEVYEAARRSFRQSLPKEVDQMLRQTDSMYARYKVVERAGTYKRALQHDGVFTPDDLLGAAKARGSAGQVARGEALLQAEANQAVKVFEGLVPRGHKLDKGLTGLATGGALLAEPTTGLALIGGLALPNNVMRKLMTGYYQKRPAELASVLRQYGVTPSTVVAAGAASGTGR